jgi:hypothetical protein
MSATGFILLVVVSLAVCLSIYYLRTLPPPLESFDSGTIPHYAQTTTALNNQFQMGGPNSILTTMDLSPLKTQLNQALALPDPTSQGTPPTDYSPLFVQNPAIVFTKQDSATCKNAMHPNQLPPSTSKVRCGWWYVDDPSVLSVGTLGTYMGPMFPNALPPGGVWMWNLAEAAKKEDIKRCKRLKACAVVGYYNATPGVQCGFCPSLGYGVPVDGAGNVKYSDSGCDVAISLASQCPSPSDGGGGGVAVASDEGTIVQEVCNARTPTGLITAACAIQQATTAGMATTGGFIQTTQAGTNTPLVSQAYTILQSYAVPNWWTDPAAMMRWCDSIVRAQTSGATQTIRNAAITLATGAPVDICPTDPTVRGPFDLTCMQQLFREKKCQPAGARYPTQQDALATAMKTWGDLDTDYTELRSQITSPQKATQDAAVKNCLGIEMSRNTKPCTPPLLPSGANNLTLEGFSSGASSPFSLQLHNYPSHTIVFPGQSQHVRADAYPPKEMTALRWNLGAKPNTIRISPVQNDSLVFRHRGFELHADPYNPSDRLLGLDSSFFVRDGTADPTKVSFESVNYPGRFLRHSGFRLYLHPNDGSPLFKADSTFQTLNGMGRPVDKTFYQSRASAGWRAVGTWLSNVAIGSDGVLFGSNKSGNTYTRGSIDGPWEYLNVDYLKYLDCANSRQVVGTSFDGSVFRFRNNTWTRLPLNVNGTLVGNGSPLSCVYATVNSEGHIGVVVKNGNTNLLYTSFNDANLTPMGPGNWITFGTNGAYATLVGATSEVVFSAPSGKELIAPPSKIVLTKIFMSKSNDRDILAISADKRLYGLDVHKKWSELPNPLQVDWAGLNGERIVGVVSTAPNDGSDNIWTKQIKEVRPLQGAAAQGAAAQGASGFVVVDGTVMKGTSTVPFYNRGLEQIKRECREMAGCVGFNYSPKSKSGTFVKGRETGAMATGALDGDWVGESIPIDRTVPLPNGEQVYVAQQSTDTKMVSTTGVAKYYKGLSSAFDPSMWNTYANAPGHYIALAPPSVYAYYRKTA